MDSIFYAFVLLTLSSYAYGCFSKGSPPPPPVGWTKWSDYSECSATCGQGFKTRTRDCLSLEPDCPGEVAEEKSCGILPECSSFMSGVTNGIQNEERCKGTLSLVLEGESGTITRTVNSHRQVLHLVVSDLRSHGNCCWQIFSKHHFTGKSDLLTIGRTWGKPVEAKSIKKVECS